MTKPFGDISKQKVPGGKNAVEQTGHCQFILGNRRKNFQGWRVRSKSENKYTACKDSHHTHRQRQTLTHRHCIQGLLGVPGRRTDKSLSAGSVTKNLSNTSARRHVSGMAVLMIKDFLVEFSFHDELVLS